MTKLSWLLLVAIPWIFSACNDNKVEKLSIQELETTKALGDSIATETQNVLLQNVAKAIQTGGTAHAITFCNEKALPLTDSIATAMNVTIQRLSDKNRNPLNAITNKADSIAWEKIKTEKTAFVTQDIVGDVYYYKPIVIMMPTCLKCHGNSAEIDTSTLSHIASKYPDDKAKGYSMGDLRGMWKIKIKETK